MRKIYLLLFGMNDINFENTTCSQKEYFIWQLVDC